MQKIHEVSFFIGDKKCFTVLSLVKFAGDARVKQLDKHLLQEETDSGI